MPVIEPIPFPSKSMTHSWEILEAEMKKIIPKTKIEWCDRVWNPYWGCKNRCKFCYARLIAKRFGKQIAKIEADYIGYDVNDSDRQRLEQRLQEFQPTFLYSNFNKGFPSDPCRIFVDSMSDICWWKSEDMQMVLKKIALYPQHTFIFLTKNPRVYNEYNFPANCWLGWTITKEKDFNNFALSCDPFLRPKSPNENNIFFASLEPLHGPIDVGIIACFDWIIVGRETGRKNAIKPEFAWLDDIYSGCYQTQTPIFMKPSLLDVFPDYVLRQEYPKSIQE